MKYIKEYFSITGILWIIIFIVLTIVYSLIFSSIYNGLIGATLVSIGLLIINVLYYIFYRP